jgi:hypothetical protein
MKLVIEQLVDVLVVEQKRGCEAANHHETREVLTINRFDNRCERAVARIKDATIVVETRRIGWLFVRRHTWSR